ncbi:MAG: Ni,Fe-hydrogenase I small subunit [Candidatus Bathyarchaeota archaeon B23]|nr:MAG: Ni,Fe-hydrogenase I small subunit [Candidatus Bathyarchaeota archaeon B23]
MEPEKIHVIWLSGQACTGCTVSFLNATHPSVVDILTGFIPQAAGITLDYHQTIMLPWGEEALAAVEAAERGELAPFVLVVEGAVPDEGKAGEGYWCAIGEEEGKPATFTERLRRLAEKAAAVVAAGTCASFGGIPHGRPNPTGAKGVMDFLGRSWKSSLGVPVVNVPGCPVHGEHLAEVLAHAVLAVRGYLPLPELDGEHRPTYIFGQTAHENCPRCGLFADGKNSHAFGEPYCMGLLGCKGPISHCDVPKRGFVEGVGGCTTIGAICIGCTEPEFPDEPYGPFLKKAPAGFFVLEKIHSIGGSLDAVWSRIKEKLAGRKL